jgi:hypothetical protein
MRNDSLAQSWITIAGVALIAAGLLGFIDNPIVGSRSDALFQTGTVHNLVHVVTGLLALWIGFGLKGEMQANGVIGFGILYAVVFVVLLVSGNLFGLFQYPANAGDHVLHGALAVVSLAVGWMARNAATTPTMTR